jgi:DNA polymerase-3 subunit gamma/tau
MSASTSLYRKYRSQSFDELVGQEPVVRTLKNAIASGRLSHAYLFTGPRGVGKTSAARLLARAANCTATKKEKPCNECPNCLAATRDIATDLIEIDAASNTGVDNIRDVIERANFAPSVWNTKFYIVDEVHMLSTSAFNALLKTLEEPPSHTAFILATTEVHKVPATVASRCQRYDFRRIPLTAMVERLQYVCQQEGIEAEAAALELVARQATGSLRDALSLLDQLRVYAEKAITLQSVQEMLGAGGSEEVATFIDTLLDADMAEALRQINWALEEGRDLRQYNRQIVEHLRDLMLVKTGAASSASALLDVTNEMKARLGKQAERVDLPTLLRWTQIFGDSDGTLRSTVYGQLPLEMAIVEALLPSQPVSPSPHVQDRSAEIAAATGNIGAVPPATAKPPERAERQNARPSGAPPPIHVELETIRRNGAESNGEAGMPEPVEGDAVEVAELAESLAPPDDAPPVSAGDDYDRLAALWPDLVEQLRARSKDMAAVFRNTDMVRLVQVSAGVCVISFRDPLYAKRAMENTPHPRRDVIESALSRVLGYRCRLEAITFAQAQSGRYGDAAEPLDESKGKHKAREKPSPYQTTRGKAAMNIFGIEKFEETE